MKKELRIFFTALMFLTRLPVPKTTDHNPDYLQKAAKYFPMIGWVVGIICGLTFAAGNFLSTPIAAVLCIIAGLVTTGAFHEDGFADVCDGFGGGWTKEKILAIMKDSRLGTFGVAGLIMIFLLKYLLLVQIAMQISNSGDALSSFENFFLPPACHRSCAYDQPVDAIAADPKLLLCFPGRCFQVQTIGFC